jgi:hypothetical protein
MITLTKEWLLKTIAELEEERDAVPCVVNEDATMALAAMKLALASLEAEPGRNPVLAYADNYRDMAKHGVESIPVWSVITDLERNIAPLYIAHPAPVSVPAAMEMDDDFDSSFEHGKAVGWNACRAAILQGADGNSPAHSGCRPAQNCISPAQCGNSPAIPDGWVMVPEEPTHEMLEAGDEQFGTYDVYRRMIAASPQQK